MKKLALLFFIIGALALQCIAQKVTNLSATQQGKKVIVSYKVDGGPTDRVYNPALYYSTDGGSNYTKCKSTKAIYAKPNQTAQITWNVTNDLDYFGGSNIVFKVTTYGKLLIDGKYKTVRIGNQTWMAENLNLDVGNGCSCYKNEQSNCNKYGRLYTWEAAKRAADKIAGWHLPTDAEWKQLERYLGMSKSAADDTDYRGGYHNGCNNACIGKKMKSTSGWDWSSWGGGGNGSNSSGFSVLPAGSSSKDGSYHQSLGSYTSFWTATPYNTSDGRMWIRKLDNCEGGVGRAGDYRVHGCSIRLVKD